jgi:cullin-associated NEDD8-dissociated protein 1
VFNFYVPDYQPFGPVLSAGLVSPELQITTAPAHIAWLNGMRSLFKHSSLTNCEAGFGVGNAVHTPLLNRNRGEYQCWKRDWQVPGLAAEGYATVGEATGDTVFRSSLDQEPPSANATAIVGELSVLLTGGRLGAHNRAIIEAAYTDKRSTNGAKYALSHARILITAAADFHVTNTNARQPTERLTPAPVVSQNRSYKAVVVLFMAGGADTWNLLVPMAGDLHQEYQAARGNGTGGVALLRTSLSQINANASAQPCSKFGVHSRMPWLHSRYAVNGDAAFLANTGTLVEPVTAAEMKSKKVPISLFAHNLQVEQTQSVHAAGGRTKGVLGRVAEALSSHAQPFRVAPYSSSGVQKILAGEVLPDIIAGESVKAYKGLVEFGASISNMSAATSSSAFASAFNQGQQFALAKAELLSAVLDKAEYALSRPFTPAPGTEDITDTLTGQFKAVAKLIKAHADPAIDTERGLFYVQLGGFDTHFYGDEVVGELFSIVDHAMENFQLEMEAQGMWANVTIVSASDFGRTLRSNGKGTDHAWGGNYWVTGGAVRGGQIMGTYPATLDPTNPYMQAGSRMVPTTSWEAVWHGLALWLGVEEGQMASVLPNMHNFPASHMIGKRTMFKDEQ